MNPAVYKQIDDLNEAIRDAKSAGKTIGFVPTMGALHKGHLSLIHAAQNQSDLVVVSIFVNPTQFNNSSDLENYPRTLEADLEQLSRVGCDIVFTPEADDIYKDLKVEKHDYGRLTHALEGAFRPGHFDGVITIVRKLLQLVQADMAFFGEKDFQQLAVIQHLAKTEKLNTEIIGCQTVREIDGLAMSSRNTLLSPAERQLAANISRILYQCKGKVEQMNPIELKEWVVREFQETAEITLEYFDVIDSDTFKPVDSWEVKTQAVVACEIAGIRLIDNIRVFEPSSISVENTVE